MTYVTTFSGCSLRRSASASMPIPIRSSDSNISTHSLWVSDIAPILMDIPQIGLQGCPFFGFHHVYDNSFRGQPNQSSYGKSREFGHHGLCGWCWVPDYRTEQSLLHRERRGRLDPSGYRYQ